MIAQGRPSRWGVAALCLGVLAAAAWWAIREVGASPVEAVPSPSPVVYEVTEDTLERTISFTAVAEWELSAVGENHRAGVVTRVGVEPGSLINPGDVLYEVEGRAVVAAAGAVPSFRDLSLGAVGEDVEQLQELLAASGHDPGAIDGRFGTATRRAVLAWQEALGAEPDGTVRKGDIVFVDGLPARGVLGDDILERRTVSTGVVAVRVAGEEPRFTVPLAPEQRDLVPVDASVRLSHRERVWQARIAAAVEDEEGYELVLEGADGRSICAPECAEVIPLGERVSLEAEIVVLEPTTGPVVPVAALRSEADGSVTVSLADGERREIEVLASTDGLAVVDGLDTGEAIVLEDGGSDG